MEGAYSTGRFILFKRRVSNVLTTAVLNVNAISCPTNTGTGVRSHFRAAESGVIIITGNYSITGGSGTHLLCESGGKIIYFNGYTVTISGTPAFSVAFAKATGESYMRISGPVAAGGVVVFSGAATGVRYIVSSNSVIDCSSPAPRTRFFLEMRLESPPLEDCISETVAAGQCCSVPDSPRLALLL